MSSFKVVSPEAGADRIRERHGSVKRAGKSAWKRAPLEPRAGQRTTEELAGKEWAARPVPGLITMLDWIFRSAFLAFGTRFDLLEAGVETRGESFRNHLLGHVPDPTSEIRSRSQPNPSNSHGSSIGIMTTTMSKRTYTRRTEQERIQELEARLAQVKARLEAKKHKDSPILREWAKSQRVLKKFIQAALDGGRQDLALSAEAFAAGLERAIHTNPEEGHPRRRGRPGRLETDSFQDRT